MVSEDTRSDIEIAVAVAGPLLAAKAWIDRADAAGLAPIAEVSIAGRLDNVRTARPLAALEMADAHGTTIGDVAVVLAAMGRVRGKPVLTVIDGTGGGAHLKREIR